MQAFKGCCQAQCLCVSHGSVLICVGSILGQAFPSWWGRWSPTLLAVHSVRQDGTPSCSQHSSRDECHMGSLGHVAMHESVVALRTMEDTGQVCALRLAGGGHGVKSTQTTGKRLLLLDRGAKDACQSPKQKNKQTKKQKPKKQQKNPPKPIFYNSRTNVLAMVQTRLGLASCNLFWGVVCKAVSVVDAVWLPSWSIYLVFADKPERRAGRGVGQSDLTSFRDVGGPQLPGEVGLPSTR